MNTHQTNKSEGSEERLPFDPRTILTGFWRRRYLLAVWLVISGIAGIVGGLTLGTRTWESYSVMKYQPPPADLSGGVYDPPAVHTQLNLVKLRTNLAETRSRLGLECSLETLGKACDVSNPRDTQLLIFRVRWDSAELVADIANTLSSVYILAQRRVRQEELTEARKYLQRRRTEVERQLMAAQQSRPDKDRVVALEPEDLQREIRSCQTKIDALDVIYEIALSKQKSLEMQISRVEGITEEVKRKIAEEQDQSAAMEGLSNLNIRVERIREAIMDDRVTRVNQISLKQWEDRIAYDKELMEKGFLSKVQYDAELAQYDKLKAQAVDTDQVKEWKEELDDLYTRIRPTNSSGTASAPILRDLLMRLYDLQLSYAGIVEQIENTKASRDEAAARLNDFVRSRDSGATNGWHIEAWRDEIRDTDNALAKVVALQDSTTSDFQVVSKAEASPRPAQSQRRMVAMGIAGLLVILGFGVVLGLELLDTRIKSPADLSLKVSEPVIAVVPDGQVECPGTSKEVTLPQLEAMRLAARHVRAAASRVGKKILITSPGAGEGRTTLAVHLAFCLGQQGLKVNVIDGTVRGNDRHASLRNILGTDGASGPGLDGLLAHAELATDQALQPAPFSNVKFLPCLSHAGSPDVLGSARMGEILDEASEDVDLVLIDGPTSLPYADAALLAEHCDAVVLVARSRQCRVADLRQSVARLKETEKPIIGVVLNAVDQLDLGPAHKLLTQRECESRD